MVLQFLQAQLTDKTSQTRDELSRAVVRCFGRERETARNIKRWEKSWIDNRIIPERKNRIDAESWIYDEDLRMSLRNFAKKEGDRTYYEIYN